MGVTQQALADLGVYLAVKPEKPTTNKELRIVQTLEPALAASPPLLRVYGDAFPELRAEALAFPVAAHDDLLDALAGAFGHASSVGESHVVFVGMDLSLPERRRFNAIRERQIRIKAQQASRLRRSRLWDAPLL